MERRAGASLARRLETVLGVGVSSAVRLGGGQVGEAVRCTLADGREVVAKTSPGTSLEVEGFMLRYLAEHSPLPVPEVLYVDSDVLVLRYVEAAGGTSQAAERHAAELLARLHDITAARFGFERDTLIGPFPLDNAWSESWPEFYADRRLRPMAAAAHDRGMLPAEERRRVERLAAGLPARFDLDPPPALIHGDVWRGNVLMAERRVAAFLDPAIYFAHAEVELAFIDLFGTFGEGFHRVYQARRPVDAGYQRWRRDLYQLFPLLVHVALFGGAYLSGLRQRLDRLGA